MRIGKMRRRRLRDLSIVQNIPNSDEANSEQQTVIGSSNVPETLDEPVEFQSNVKFLLHDRERVGTRSRQKQKFMHTVESKSFASVAEAEEVSSGQKVGCLQLFEITHRKKDGSPMTSEAGQIMEKLKEKKAEYEVIASIDSSVNLENIDNKIITEVLGPERNGRVRFQGSGVTPTQYFGSGSQQYMPSRSQVQAEVQRLRDQRAQIQASTVEQIVEVERKYEELQQQLRADATAREATVAAREAEAAAMAAEQSRKYDKLQLQLQHMMKMFQQSQKLSF
ncbi:hypothetical protein PVK06_019517 [Gossypium arboreum]|uniref:Uncharacterized protein n=1 Tax=Gossypium arboreum TaxID=29729 RepID=A0ABR0PJX9_GOSAR|nr:hypothetical protein PVK06_019517 [Gossypium arboreum]